MLSSEIDDFKFLKTAKNIKCTCIMNTIVPGTVLSLQTSLLLTRNMNVTVAKELYYIFDAEYTLKDEYCKFRNSREKFIFANSVKRHVSH